MNNPRTAKTPREPIAQTEEQILDPIVDQGSFGADPRPRDRRKLTVKEFVAQVLEGSTTVAEDTEKMINARIAQIDHLLAIQLNEIIRHPGFAKLESSWRGLKWLVDHDDEAHVVQIKVKDAAEVSGDIELVEGLDPHALRETADESQYGLSGDTSTTLIEDPEGGEDSNLGSSQDRIYDAKNLNRYFEQWLGLKFRTEDKLVGLVEGGLPLKIIDCLVQRGLSRPEISDIIIPRRTLKHRKSTKQPLSTEESDRAVRVARTLARAQAVLGNPESALGWLRTPKKRFDGRSPLQMLSTESGGRLVEEMLIQIDEGMFA